MTITPSPQWRAQVESVNNKMLLRTLDGKNLAADPDWLSGLPICSASCPYHDGKRCEITGGCAPNICEPVVIEMTKLLNKLQPREVPFDKPLSATDLDDPAPIKYTIFISIKLRDRLRAALSESRMTESDFIVQAIHNECVRWEKTESDIPKHPGVPCTSSLPARTNDNCK